MNNCFWWNFFCENHLSRIYIIGVKSIARANPAGYDEIFPATSCISIDVRSQVIYFSIVTRTSRMSERWLGTEVEEESDAVALRVAATISVRWEWRWTPPKAAWTAPRSIALPRLSTPSSARIFLRNGKRTRVFFVQILIGLLCARELASGNLARLRIDANCNLPYRYAFEPSPWVFTDLTAIVTTWTSSRSFTDWSRDFVMLVSR